MKFQLTKFDEYVLVAFEFDEVLKPGDLSGLEPPNPVLGKFSHKGVVLSGRGPVWLYGFLVHFYHPTAFVAIFDPRLNGAVVVESHIPGKVIGDVIKIE